MRKQQSFETILVGRKILLREGLAKILRSANFRIVASVSCADDLLPTKLELQQPLFLIIHTGDDFDVAIEQIEFLKKQYPGGRIAIVADHYRLGELVSAFRAGANGYFVDVVTCDVFIKSMELVMMGETIFPPPFLSFVLGPEGEHLGAALPCEKKNQAILITAQDIFAPQLSAREKSILRCLVEGESNKCIARKMDIAEATVKVHVKAILRKIGVQNRTQAAIWGINNGSLAPPASDSPPSPISEVNKRLPGPVEEIAKIDQMRASLSLGAIEQEANHVAVPRIDRLIRKVVNRRTSGATRTDK
jgi:DNA-binding NarL/FixJ family response regulator